MRTIARLAGVSFGLAAAFFGGMVYGEDDVVSNSVRGDIDEFVQLYCSAPAEEMDQTAKLVSFGEMIEAGRIVERLGVSSLARAEMLKCRTEHLARR